MPTLAEQAAAAVGLARPAAAAQAASRPATAASPPAAMPVAVVPGFATRRECALVIAYYEEHLALHPAPGTGDGFFDGRMLWKTSFARGSRAWAILHAWQLKAEAVVSTHHGRRLWSDNVQVVKWPPGKAMEPHRDDRHPDPTERHNTPYREIAGLVYLNHDYQGGSLYFPELNGARKPETGEFVFFPGHLWHGVEAPTADRYTSPQWFTSDRAHRDPTLEPG